jgi:hypothetical protein
MRIQRVIARLNTGPSPTRYYHRRERIPYPWQRTKPRRTMSREEFRMRLMEDLHVTKNN